MTTTAGRMSATTARRPAPASPSAAYRRGALMGAHRVSPAADADFYPTPPWAARAMADLILRLDPSARSVWEPCCGAGHMVHGLRDYFADVVASDLLAYDGNALFDFTQPGPAPVRKDWIAFNPPFNRLAEFIDRALERAGRGVAVLSRVATLETMGRFDLVHGAQGHAVFAPFAERVPMHKGRWEPDGRSAAFYAVLLWFKPVVGFVRPQVLGEPRAVTIPFPPGTQDRFERPGDVERFGVRG